MLKMGDSVMFNIGKNSKVFKVECDQFIVDGTAFVTLEGYRGFITVSSLVKVHDLFEHYGTVSKEAMEAEFIEEEEIPKERHVLDEEDIRIMQEVKSHINVGITKLKKRNLRGVNIEIELTQYIRQQLRKE